MSSEHPSLVEVRRLPEEAALFLRWSDNFEAKPTYRYLCGYCPCAGCQGHGGAVDFHEPGRNVEPNKIEAIGNYAISIGWLDGCQDGIYSYRFLREICSFASGPEGSS